MIKSIEGETKMVVIDWDCFEYEEGNKTYRRRKIRGVIEWK